jgi:hydroxyacylglutathione hydrolase
MPYEIIPIASKMVNCYLIKTADGFFLVDTGMPFLRGAVKKALAGAGCKPGNLELVVITHGDFDHTGNATFLQKKYGTKILAHKSEAGTMERAELSDRKNKPKLAFRMMIPITRLLAFRPVKADIYIEGDRDLKEYGIDANIIHIPGHSVGSIGVVTKDGDLFCGDLLNNSKIPQRNILVDDAAEMDASIEKLKALNIKTVYPGHGKPFTMEEFIKNIAR